MSGPSSMRKVNLIDGRVLERTVVPADLYRDYPPEQLEIIETLWAKARENAATTGLAPLEHSHWDWRNKADSVETGRHMLVAIECAGEPQGIMAILRTPRLARLSQNHAVYVDYVESAPWNIKSPTIVPRFLGVGTILISEAIRLSLEMGLAGRVGLHSLPQAEAFYARCGMTRIGPDADYFDLTYFEFAAQAAVDWLAIIGG